MAETLEELTYDYEDLYAVSRREAIKAALQARS